MEHGIVDVVSDQTWEDAHQEHGCKLRNLVDVAILHDFVIYEGVLPVELDPNVCVSEWVRSFDSFHLY